MFSAVHCFVNCTSFLLFYFSSQNCNSDTDNVSGYPFSLTAEEWMWNCEQLAEFARIGNKLCSTGPIGLINFGISDEHVDYDWNMIEKIMCARSMRNIERTKESDLTVWYCCKGTCVDDETPAFTRNSPSSDKENRIGRYSPRRTPRSPQKPLFKTTPQNSNHVTDESACIFPPGVLDRVSGLVCPFTGKLFYNVDELEQHLRCSYPVFEFEKVTCTSSVICFVVSSVISRTQWHKPRLEFGSGKVSSVKETSPQLKPRYGPPEEIPVKRKHDLPKAQMIPFGEMSFVHPTYSQVPGPSSSKIYHSVVEDTCDWKNHLMERNIRDYIDDTPQEKEFMLLHNRFRSKFRHLIVGEKLTLDFYTKFVECCGMEMKKKRIRAHCVARLTRLVQQDKMTPTNMATLTQKLYELGPNDPS
ncbi:hypothetical protein DICVIV_07562 [Dictyocaulus viviparus]|uniref:C2H2-type domain-containing protein n=1 Tax=Dictyocaulus viviparus TaxID=29172 RepID=A0A0D8XRM9_DICVI|nr:hypothetical protein DICVIV_07562 [Dictyocaulus viviparus]